MKIHLIRHGKTTANEKHLYCGFTDVSLSERGITELVKLKKEINYPKGILFINSGLKRAIQTMDILFDNPISKQNYNIREYNFGEFEMKSHNDLKDNADYINWISDIDNVCCPNGESKNEFTKRVIAEFYEIIDFCKKQNIRSTVIVTHGGVISTIMDSLFHDNNKNFYNWHPDNGRGYTILFEQENAKNYIAI